MAKVPDSRLPEAEKEALYRLVRGIVLSQGNVYIKELLREKDLPVGATKADFESNLLQAIADGKLAMGDVEKWLSRIEGWGDQHVYLFNVSDTLAGCEEFSSVTAFRAKVKAEGLGNLWMASTSSEFPEKPKLTSISFDGSRLQLTWHEGSMSWVRDKKKDYEEQIDGEFYQFRAYRERAWRTVMRFDLRLNDRLAAILLSVRVKSSEHEENLKELYRTIGQLIDVAEMRRSSVPIANVIKYLDQAQVSSVSSVAQQQTGARTYSTRLSASGAYVEFASTTDEFSYWDSEPVRAVRLAVRQPDLPAFNGDSGAFEFRRTPKNRLSRDLRVHMYGLERRVRLWARMTEDDVWTILRMLACYQVISESR